MASKGVGAHAYTSSRGRRFLFKTKACSESRTDLATKRPLLTLMYLSFLPPSKRSSSTILIFWYKGASTAYLRTFPNFFTHTSTNRVRAPLYVLFVFSDEVLESIWVAPHSIGHELR